MASAPFLRIEGAMKFLSFRYNRATYFVFLVAFVAILVMLINVMEKPPRGVGEFILIMLAVPRLHDLGRSGWWVAVPILVEFAMLWSWIARGLTADAMLIEAGLLNIAILSAMIVLGLIRGQDEPNQWGDPPPAGINWRNAYRS